MTDISSRIQSLQSRIALAAAKADKDPSDIKLIAVTKTHPVAAIEAALKAGITDIAENKVQDAQRKLPFISTPYSGFHFIGHLQSNKINQVLSLNPVLIHSIDSFYIAEKMDNTLKRTNRRQAILIQVNTSGEESKSGVEPDALLEMVEAISHLKALSIMGLMTIGRYFIDSNLARPYFQSLKALFEKVKAEDIPGVEMKYLSMGMTDDFEIAIEEGSNMVRIGSAIFGQREYGD